MPSAWRKMDPPELNGIPEDENFDVGTLGAGLIKLVKTSPYIHWWRWFHFSSRTDPTERAAMERLYFPAWVLEARESLKELDDPEADDDSRWLPGGLQFDWFVDWKIDDTELPQLDPDTLLVGVIDSGMPLSHSRLLDGQGKTRIVSAWQMSSHLPPTDPKVPFGRELRAAEIDELLQEHRSETGVLDEAAFNQAAGLVDMQHRQATRELAGGFSHGAAVLDLAAGVDPNGPRIRITDRRAGHEDAEVDPNEFANKVKVISISLPNRSAIGLSGEFLDLFVLSAMHRITEIAKALWRNRKVDESEVKGDVNTNGFPLMVNLSYGRQAGDKMFKTDPFGKLLDEMIDNYRRVTQPLDKEGVKIPKNLGVCDLIVPAGNDNLARVQSDVEALPSGKRHVQDLRIQPGDQSCSYVEIWAGREDGLPNDAFQIAVTQPGDDAEVGDDDFIRVTEGMVWAFGPKNAEIAQLRSIQIADRSAGVLLCIAPTQHPDAPHRVAPAGKWRIHVRNANDSHQISVNLMVQSEQSLLDRTTTSRRAYFEEAGYQRFNKTTGGAIDSFSIDRINGEITVNDHLSNYDNTAPEGTMLRRHGTLIATAINENACIAGYRVSDGAPAPYSSTGLGRKAVAGRGAPTAALPSDDGAAHPGILTAGASDGSTAIAQGTSFASALATRHIVEQRFIGDGTKRSAGGSVGKNLTCREKLNWDAEAEEAEPNGLLNHVGTISVTEKKPNTVAKLGGGRIKTSKNRRIERYLKVS